MSRQIETFRITWNNITIELRWEPRWLNIQSEHFATGHLEFESIHPEKEPLPMTETGYRSHFMSVESMAAYGGPVAFVEAWLESDSQAPEWRAKAAQSRQFSLF